MKKLMLTFAITCLSVSVHAGSTERFLKKCDEKGFNELKVTLNLKKLNEDAKTSMFAQELLNYFNDQITDPNAETAVVNLDKMSKQHVYDLMIAQDFEISPEKRSSDLSLLDDFFKPTETFSENCADCKKSKADQKLPTDSMSLLYEKLIQRLVTDGADAKFDDIRKMVEANSTLRPDQLWSKITQKIENDSIDKLPFKYNREKKSIFNIIEDKRLDCSSGTTFWQLMRMMSVGPQEDTKNGRINLAIFSPGHVKSGFIDAQGKIYSVEHTVRNPVAQDHGLYKDFKEPVTVALGDDFLKLRLVGYYLDNKKNLEDINDCRVARVTKTSSSVELTKASNQLSFGNLFQKGNGKKDGKEGNANSDNGEEEDLDFKLDFAIGERSAGGKSQRPPKGDQEMGEGGGASGTGARLSKSKYAFANPYIQNTEDGEKMNPLSYNGGYSGHPHPNMSIIGMTAGAGRVSTHPIVCNEVTHEESAVLKSKFQEELRKLGQEFYKTPTESQVAFLLNSNKKIEELLIKYPYNLRCKMDNSLSNNGYEFLKPQYSFKDLTDPEAAHFAAQLIFNESYFNSWLLSRSLKPIFTNKGILFSVNQGFNEDSSPIPYKTFIESLNEVNADYSRVHQTVGTLDKKSEELLSFSIFNLDPNKPFPDDVYKNILLRIAKLGIRFEFPDIASEKDYSKQFEARMKATFKSFGYDLRKNLAYFTAQGINRVICVKNKWSYLEKNTQILDDSSVIVSDMQDDGSCILGIYNVEIDPDYSPKKVMINSQEKLLSDLFGVNVSIELSEKDKVGLYMGRSPIQYSSNLPGMSITGSEFIQARLKLYSALMSLPAERRNQIIKTIKDNIPLNQLIITEGPRAKYISNMDTYINEHYSESEKKDVTLEFEGSDGKKSSFTTQMEYRILLSTCGFAYYGELQNNPAVEKMCAPYQPEVKKLPKPTKWNLDHPGMRLTLDGFRKRAYLEVADNFSFTLVDLPVLTKQPHPATTDKNSRTYKEYDALTKVKLDIGADPDYLPLDLLYQKSARKH